MGAVGEAVRRYRLRAGLSQSDLAGEDFSASYVSLIESGKRQPSDEALAAFARRLGCGVDDLRSQPPDFAAAVELELAYVRLALGNGEPAAARGRLESLLARDLPLSPRHEALLLLAETHEKSADLDAAIRVLKPVYDQCLQGRSPLSVMVVANTLCWYCMMVGDFQAAVRVGEQGMKAGVEAGLDGTSDHLKLQATVMTVHLEMGDAAVALAIADELMQTARQAGSSFGEAAAYWNAAVVAESRGRLHEALRLSQRALGLMGEQGTSRNLARLECTTAELVLRADPDRAWYAATILDRSLATLTDLGSPADLGAWENVRAMAHLLTGDARAAETLARRARVHLQDAGEVLQSVQAVISLGDALVAQGHQEAGLDSYREAIAILGGVPASWRVAVLYRSVGYRLSLAADAVAAAHCLDLALDARGVAVQNVTADVAFGRRRPTASPVRPESVAATGLSAADPAPQETAAAEVTEAATS
ncbi:MAG TPA: helix-turn-helix domain-containing protein [Kineosporiaceae bacterium]|nr:helix-turn-helix domain-containing protein [Kineosporiaceae bacterium]